MTPFWLMGRMREVEVTPEALRTGVNLARAFIAWAGDAGCEDPEGLRAFLRDQDALFEARAVWFRLGSSNERFSMSGYWGHDRWSDVCRSRSGVAFLVALGPPWWGEALDLAGWDTWIGWHANRAGLSSQREIPDGVPASHGWWFIDGGPPDACDP